MAQDALEQQISWDSFWVTDRPGKIRCQPHLPRPSLCPAPRGLDRADRDSSGEEVKRVLEIGGAYSKNLWLLPPSARQKVLFLGLDSCLEPALKTGKYNPHPNVRFIVGDLMSPPLKSSMDMIYSSGVVEHFRRPKEFLLACRELLRPGGRLVAGYPSFSGLTGKVQRAVNPEAFKYHFSLPCEEMAGELSSCGFMEVKAEYLGPFNPNMIDWGQGLWRRLLMYAAFAAARPLEWLCRLTGASPAGERFSSYIVATGIKPVSNP